MRRVIVTVPLVLALVGCGGLAPEGEPVPRPRAGTTVGLMYGAGGRGDHAYNDSVAFGLDRAKVEFGLRTKELKAWAGEGDAPRIERLRLLARSGCDPIIGVGFPNAAAVKRVAAEFPRLRFALLDDASATAANITNLVFAVNEGAFLVGAAGAFKSTKDNLGFVGGVNAPQIRQFEVGYRAGIAHVRPKDRIQVEYLSQAPDLSGFSNPALARTAAARMYASGADVVFQAAGSSGAGVFEAALAAGGWAIGVVTDQAKSATPSVRGRIITSMVKEVDVAVFDFIVTVLRGTVKAGPITYDLKAGGVDYTTTGGHIRDFVPRLDALKRQIINGTIKVPTG
ncbi:BMP family ABC transporter substrate-binding protein [Acrocarpospora macrocephala]|uniref:BMP family ABC transporter substrate-binding protein n=1 Tax=Acrocarpospora macrocephala TaxID=150177 RepID=A0A5M3X420_9ACTN|nr:BMP family ABC transporter substrate-binding protein [Acrocarpospora macrocephala]GES15402.1 BMP family ABC transporter substrate-binding protein [Acrocarpospora macrocephala]